jgi:hypothetical protein
MPPEEDSSLERLNKRLYAPNNPGEVFEPSNLPRQKAEVPRGWKQEPPAPPNTPRPRKKLPLSVRFLILAAGFFVIAAGTATLFLFLGGRSVSTDNIIISIDGPTTAAGGDTVPLLVTIENHNPVTITGTTLAATFPNDTRSADDVTKSITRYDETLGDIPAGEAVTRTVRAVLFGKENQTVTIPIKVEYHTANSNSVFTKGKDYTLTLTTSPVSVSATSVSEISPGQSFTLNVLVRSNAAKPLTAIALKVDYPFGFVVNNTSIDGNNGLYILGTLNPGEERKLAITGTLAGQTNDERIFHFTVGSTENGKNGALGVTYANSETDVTLTKAFLDVALSLNGDPLGSPTVGGGDSVQGSLKWTNTLPTNILDGQITVSLSGTGFDPATVTTQNGFYQSSNATIRFDRDTSSGLANLNPGDTGAGTFFFKIKSGDALAALINPTVTVSVSASGRRINEAGVPDTLSSTLTRTVKITSGLNVSSKLVKTIGPFVNSGPFPPTVGQTTNYAVLLTATNGVNSIGGATVTMTLPSYVKFTGATSPSDGSITYTESTHTVKWVVGDMNPSASRQGAFQIAFLPSITQKGTSPALVSPQTITGIDRFTQRSVSATAPSLDTQAKSDPAYQGSAGTVQ